MRRGVRYLPDTNVILRYLLKDNPAQFEKAEVFFESIRTGAEKALLLESVVVECVYVLSKFYKVPKDEVVEILSELLRYKGFVNEDKGDLLDALALFAANNLDLVDCVLVAKARRGGMTVFTFDNGVNKLLA